jgi:predicted O-linked N-acetylglucosamine transferase (SPINDLY family)
MKPGRNDPCPCGSGRKYKQCCGVPGRAALGGVPQLLQSALASHQAGQLQQAEALYRQALAAAPANPDALHLLGVLCYQSGRLDAAVDLIGRALAANPAFPQASFNLAVALKALGRLEEAAAAYRRAIALKPDYAEAHDNLGNILKELGRDDEAVACYRQALAANPASAVAHNNLGVAQKSLGLLDEAMDSYRRAIAINPDYAEAHNNLGNALLAQGRLPEAVACLDRAALMQPDCPEVWYQLGSALRDLNRMEEAAACFRREAGRQPDHVGAHNNLGNALLELGRPEEAAASFRRAIGIDPGFAIAHGNLGNALGAMARLEEAEASYRRAIALDPGHVIAHNNLGNILKEQGRLEEAVEMYRKTCALAPDLTNAHSNLLFSLNYLADLDADALYAAHREFGARHAAAETMPHGNDPDPLRRLRIGYVSWDLRDHAVAYFLEPVLEHHEPSRIEITCYSNNPVVDATTLRLQKHADHWRSIAGLSDEAADAMIRADAIDILVDLSGHTGGNRLTLFARRPAPVQATWIGYANTTGMSAMDYRLTDANLDPIGMTERYHSEQLVRLPVSACFSPAAHAPEVNALPALAAGHITFASFNNFTKVTAETIACWAQVLAAVPASRLMLLIGEAENPAARQRVEALFARHGIAPERLQLVGRRPLAEYLALHQQVDIALDPFPYNGGTTSVHSLWMGVPVVTLAGSTAVSRVGVTILANAGLAELIAQSVDEYVEIARSLAQDTARLGRMRAGLRADLQASPLFDAEALTRALEESYRNMWKIWCTRKIDETRTQ